MKKIFTIAGGAIILAFSTAAMAQTDQPAPVEIVVRAPPGLTDTQQRNWDKLNKDAAQLQKNLAKLRVRILDDREEVAEAQRRVERAQSKLDSERRDLARTQDRIDDAEKDRAKIERKRIEIVAD